MYMGKELDIELNHCGQNIIVSVFFKGTFSLLYFNSYFLQ